jgi:hypothetical protein
VRLYASNMKLTKSLLDPVPGVQWHNRQPAHALEKLHCMQSMYVKVQVLVQSWSV